MTELRMTTLNIKNDLGWEQFLEDLRDGIRGQDVVFLQEVMDRNLERALKQLGAQDTFRAIQAPEGHSARRQAILLNRATMRMAYWTVLLLHTSRLFPSATRHLLKVVARHTATGRKVRLACVHLVPHADGGKRDPAGRITNKPRRDLVLRSLQVLSRWFRRSGAVSVAAGDFNVDLDADLKTRDPKGVAETLNRAGAIAPQQIMGSTRVKSHGHNQFDQFWVKVKASQGKIVSQRVLPKRHSDHRGYRVTLDLHPVPGR